MFDYVAMELVLQGGQKYGQTETNDLHMFNTGHIDFAIEHPQYMAYSVLLNCPTAGYLIPFKQSFQ